MIEVSDKVGITISAFDIATHSEAYVAMTTRGAAIRITDRARAVLCARAAGTPFDAIARDLEQRGLAVATAAEVQAFHEQIVRRIVAADAAANDGGAGHLRFPVLGPRLVAALCRPFTILFNPRIAALCAVAIVAAGCAAAVALHTSAKPHMDAGGLARGYLLYFLSLIFHEMGHASATLAFGEAPAGIGLTIYLVFPALYSDVTRTWRLRRAQRVVIDVAGSYFQLLAAAAYVALFCVTRDEGLYFAVGAIVVTTLFNLNPLFKFDGYWFASDALGVANLSKQPVILAKALWGFVLGRRESAPRASRTLYLLAIYSVAVFAAWGYMFWRIGWALIAGAPRLLGDAALLARHPPLATPKALELIAFRIAALVITAIGVYNLVRSSPFFKRVRAGIAAARLGRRVL